MSKERVNLAPSDEFLASKLGSAKPHWDALMQHISTVCAEAKGEWKFYGEKYGWQFKLEHKKKAILYMIPHEGSFGAALALKEPALSRLSQSDLPPALIQEIQEGRLLPEGKAARIEVTTAKHVAQVMTLVSLKLQ